MSSYGQEWLEDPITKRIIHSIGGRMLSAQTKLLEKCRKSNDPDVIRAVTELDYLTKLINIINEQGDDNEQDR